MRSPLRAMAAALDDAALEALAPRGLIRRAAADVEGGRVAIDAETGDGADLSVDGQKVALTVAGGAAGSRCDCPAPGMCRHRLAALMFLRDAPGAPTASDDGVPDPSPELSLPDWSGLAKSFTIDALARYAGKRAWREARERQAEASLATVDPQEGTLRVRLQGDDEPIVFLPTGGLESVLVRGPEKNRKLRIVLAALAIRHALGEADLEWPDAEEPAPVPTTQIDPRLLDQVRDLLRRLHRAALAFTPLSLEQEARKLALAGRVDDLPRLAAALRGIAAAISALRGRDADSDSSDLLRRLAEASALVAALSRAGADPPRELTGESRQTYHSLGDIGMFGLGAHLWEAPDGGRGVTTWFYAPTLKRTFSVTDARPAGADPGFEPRQAVETAPVWGHSMRRLAQAEVRLQEASASAGGRLSFGRDTRASVAPASLSVKAVSDWSCSYMDWHQLEDSLRDRFLPALSAPLQTRSCVVLVQSKSAPVAFDELTQTLTWPVADSEGRWIGLTLPYQGVNLNRIEVLDRLVGQANIWAILALAQADERGLTLEPYAVVEKEIRLLDFDVARRPSVASPTSLLDRLIALRQQRSSTTWSVSTTADATGRALDSAWAALLRHAELGSAAMPASLRQEIEAAADVLAKVGLLPVSRALARVLQQAGEDGALAAAWAVYAARQSRLRLPWITRS